jgi:hypothetical protein
MELVYFISGILFTQYLIPLLDGFIAWILSLFELKRGRIAEEMAEIELSISTMENSKQPPSNQIGFQINNDVEVGEDEYEI